MSYLISLLWMFASVWTIYRLPVILALGGSSNQLEVENFYLHFISGLSAADFHLEIA
ncbi:MAG: hypothetical protein ACPLZD_07480 [Candidatus Saccharicenans sp.]